MCSGLPNISVGPYKRVGTKNVFLYTLYLQFLISVKWKENFPKANSNSALLIVRTL